MWCLVQELHWDSAKSHAGWRARGGTASSQCPHNAEGLRPLQDARRATSHGLTLLCLWGHQGCASCAPWGCRDTGTRWPCQLCPVPLCSIAPPADPALVPGEPQHGPCTCTTAPRHHPGVPKAGVTWLSPRPHLSLPACQPLVALPLADVVWVPCLEGVPLHGALPQARLPAQPAPQPPTGALWGQRVGSGGNGGCSTITPPSPMSTLTHACKHVHMTCAHMCALTVLHTYRRTKGCTHLCSHSRAHRCAHSAVGTRMHAHTDVHSHVHTHSYAHTHLPPFSGCRSCFPPSPPCLHTEQSSHQCRAMGWDAGRARGAALAVGGAPGRAGEVGPGRFPALSAPRAELQVRAEPLPGKQLKITPLFLGLQNRRVTRLRGGESSDTGWAPAPCPRGSSALRAQLTRPACRRWGCGWGN